MTEDDKRILHEESFEPIVGHGITVQVFEHAITAELAKSLDMESDKYVDIIEGDVAWDDTKTTTFKLENLEKITEIAQNYQ